MAYYMDLAIVGLIAPDYQVAIVRGTSYYSMSPH